MKTVLSYCVILLGVLMGLPAHALEPLAPYDNFNTEFIDPDKWFVGQEGGPAAREFVREIQGKRLRLVDRAYGNTTSDSGTRFSGAFLDFPNPDAITAIQVTIQVKKVDVTGCPQNPAVSGAGVRITGSFFNTGTPTPGTFLNDVYAQVNINRLSDSTDPPNVLRVVSNVEICTAVDCSAGTTIDHDELGTVGVGETIRLLIQWDQDNHRFIFQRDDNPPIVSPYTVSDVTPSGAKRKNLFIGNSAANCTVGPRPVAYMEAFFDDVFANESASTVDLFVNGHVLKGNEEKWVRFVGEEIVRQLPGSRNDQILVAARASWWGLKEGIFTFPNPHKFSLCNVLLPNGKSKDKRLQPLETCSPGRAWQVGLAGVQVPNFSDQEVSAVVSSLQPVRTENAILVEVVNLAKFDPGQGTGAAIVASTGVLKKSWLLRHPAVGLTLVERNVTTECLNPVTLPSYCYGTEWLQTKKYAPTPDAIQQSIEDLMKIYDALAP